ncbi:solute carrier organic anion transporter family member 74D isoform X2 [Ischnura elegans]|nr:solute carrier organic anion transporter family member 74D isoform X2 [Ischnura elegans]
MGKYSSALYARQPGGVVTTNGAANGKSCVNGNGTLKSAIGKKGGEKNAHKTAKDVVEGTCGIGLCAPSWLQLFRTKQAFLVIFCITWVLQGMYYTYFVSVITTIEKLFQIQSKTTGIILSATEVGQIGSSLLLTYYGGQGHRPRWIAWGMVLFALSSFTCALPHFIFGDQLLYANKLLPKGGGGGGLEGAGSVSMLQSSLEVSAWNSSSSPGGVVLGAASSVFPSSKDVPFPLSGELCMEEPLGGWGNLSESVEDKCKEGQSESLIQSKITTVVLAMFFVSLLGVGMGQTAVNTLGIPYIDDNVASRESPLYFAITIGVRILGPALGFMLGSLCTRLYTHPTVDPMMSPTDPHWVGAWWLGLILVSGLLMLASLAMFSFPKKLTASHLAPNLAPPPQTAKQKNPSLRDFPKAVKKLLRNEILIFRTASSVLHLLPIAGIYTFLPKYLESQFRLAAHKANMIAGVGGILVMGVGIIISGVFILKVKPNARFIAAWIALTAVIYALGMGVLMLIGCPMDDFAGLKLERGAMVKFEPLCNNTCSCDAVPFSPICGYDGKTYYSSCHAGCRNRTFVDGKHIEYSDCFCMDPSSSAAIGLNGLPKKPMTASQGYCDLECSNFVWYMLLFSVFVFIHSTSEVGSMLLILRCVDPQDKAMALGLIQFAIGLFGNVPCPIVYGAVVDSACVVWDMACGKQGACWLYDVDVFRMFYHGTTGIILLCAFFVDLVVWYKAGSITFADENVPPPQEEEELNPIAAVEAGHEVLLKKAPSDSCV